MNPRKIGRTSLSPKQTFERPAVNPGANYIHLELFKEIEVVKEEMFVIKDIVQIILRHQMNKSNEQKDEKPLNVFTIQELAKFMNLSPRLQQHEQTAGNLRYLKRKDGAKIL